MTDTTLERYPDKFSLKMGLRSLKSREDGLLLELKQSYERYHTDVFDLTFDGDIVRAHRISLPFFGSFAYTLQDVINDISLSTLNKSMPTKAINKEIRDSFQLDLVATTSGSFRIIIASQETPNHETQIGESYSKQSLRLLNNLTDCKDDKEKLKEINKKIGTESMKKYQKLMEIVYKNNATIKMYDKIIPEGFHTEDIDTELARRIYNAIKDVTNNPPEKVTYFGLLTMVNVRSCKFEFIIDESEERITGDFARSIIEEATKRLNTKTNIQFDLSTKYDDVLDQQKSSWSIIAFLD
jgi:hypothetical protein